MAKKTAEHVLNNSRFTLLPYALTGPDISDKAVQISSVRVELTRPDGRQGVIDTVKGREGSFVTVDYTHPNAVNDNAAFYCKNNLPFVMGTTGGDRQKLTETVKASRTAAVIAPNMAKQIVACQAMME